MRTVHNRIQAIQSLMRGRGTQGAVQRPRTPTVISEAPLPSGDRWKVQTCGNPTRTPRLERSLTANPSPSANMSMPPTRSGPNPRRRCRMSRSACGCAGDSLSTRTCNGSHSRKDRQLRIHPQTRTRGAGIRHRAVPATRPERFTETQITVNLRRPPPPPIGHARPAALRTRRWSCARDPAGQARRCGDALPTRSRQ